MKKLLLSLLLLIVTVSLYSAEPLVKYYLNDGTFKTYNLNEIDNLKFLNAPDTLQLQVFTKDSTYYYPAQLIDSVKFEVDSILNQRIHLWHDGFKWDFGVHEIDSILIYYTKHVAVTIGTQHWMYRNLDVDHYRNGDSIPEVREPGEFPPSSKDIDKWRYRDEGAWCYLNNDPAIGKIYGKLYNWYGMNDPRDLSPVGWHVASLKEWWALIEYLGTYKNAGGRAKETGYEHWEEPNLGATNESGFTGLPAGIRFDSGTFGITGYGACFWASKIYSAFYTILFYDGTQFQSTDFQRTFGYSIRCIKE